MFGCVSVCRTARVIQYFTWSNYDDFYVHEFYVKVLIAFLVLQNTTAKHCAVDTMAQCQLEITRDWTQFRSGVFAPKFSFLMNYLNFFVVCFFLRFNMFAVNRIVFVYSGFLTVLLFGCVQGQFSFSSPIVDTVKFNHEYDFIVIGAGSG